MKKYIACFSLATQIKLQKLPVCVLALLFVFSGAFANDIATDFKNMHMHYLGLENFSMNIEVTYQAAEDGVLMKQQGRVMHAGDIHYTEMGGNKTLVHKNEFIAVNESAHLLVYNKQDQKPNDHEANAADIPAMLDSLWQNQKGLSCRYIQAQKGARKVYVEDKLNPHYSAYAITMDEMNYKLLEFVYYVRPEASNEVNKIIIRYTNETQKPKTGLPEYKISHYVTGTSGSLKPAEHYKDYELIDQTKTRYENK